MRKIKAKIIIGTIVSLIILILTLSIQVVIKNENKIFISKKNNQIKADYEKEGYVTIKFSDEKMAKAVYGALGATAFPEDYQYLSGTELPILQTVLTDTKQLTLYNSKESDKITNIKGIENFINLTELKLANNLITDISPIQHLTELTSLDLSLNKNISDISYLENNKELQKLNLSGNKIKDLTGISKLYNLTSLNISTNQITASAIEILGGLKKLTILDASTNQIDDIKPILNLTGLTELILNNNSITELEGISNLRNLKKLNIGDNGIGYNQARHILETVYVKYKEDDAQNKIIVSEYDNNNNVWINNENYSTEEEEEGKYSEDTIAKLKDLYYLNVELNNMADLFTDYGIYYMENLREIYAQGNKIYEIYGIYNLKNLEVLNLNDNEISNLDPLFMTYEEGEGEEKISKLYLQKLRKVSLAENEIEFIYSIQYENEIERMYSFADFKDLRALNLSQNHIYNISTIAYKEFDSIQLFEQTINLSVMSREEGDDFQEVILPQIFRYTLLEDSNVYSDREFSYVNTSKTTEDEKFTDREIAFVDANDLSKNNKVAKVTINGGFADGTVLTINSISGYGLETIVFSDEKLYKAVKDNIRKYINEEMIDEKLYQCYDKRNLINIYNTGNGLQAIQSLEASNYGIESVDGIKRLIALNNLDISNNKIKDIGEIALLPQIGTLNVGANQIEDLDEFNYVMGVANRKNKQDRKADTLECKYTIQKLIAYTNNIYNINEIENCIYIEHLNLLENKITDISCLNKLSYLKTLNLTDNYIDKLEVFNDLTNLQELSIANNHGEIEDKDLSNLSNLSVLTKLDLSNNYLKDISSLNSIVSLKTLILNNNLIEDLNSIKNLTRLGNLDLSQNKIEDLEGINKFIQLTTLNLKKNRISDVTDLKSLTSLVTLDLSYNKLEDISIIEILDNTYNLDEIALNDQIITIELTEEQTQGTEEINLPELFSKALKEGNLVYTTTKFATNNCSVDTENELITVSNLGSKVAWVKIKGGLAEDSQVVISEPLKGTIKYSTEQKTKDSVEATISFNRASVTVNNNEGKTIYNFTENGEFTFEFEDDYGFIGTATAKVDWIDNEGPKAEVIYSTKEITKEDIIVTITLDEECKLIEGWTLSGDEKILTKKYTANTNEKITLEDELGNRSQVDVVITNIDKIAPKIEGIVEGKIYTQSVKPIITEFNLDTIELTKDGEKVEDYIKDDAITQNGQYKLTVTDKAGNKIEVNFTVKIGSESDTLEVSLKQSSTYQIDQEKRYIKNINPNTAIQTAISNIETNGEIKVYKERTLITNKETKIGTGMTIKVSKGDEERIYTVIVTGDCNGGGTTNVADLTKLMMSRAESLATNKDESKILTGVYEKAVDLNGDGKISIGDVTKLSIFIAENK